MAKDSSIEWTTHTFNPWIGCAKVSPGCAHCYAESMMDHRLGKVQWGPGQPRQRTSPANWQQPLKWDRQAAKELDALRPGMSRVDYPLPRTRVFCASLADWLDPEVPAAWLAALLELIHQTPHLDWLLLTKRPQLWRQRLEQVVGLSCITGCHAGWIANRWLHGDAPANVWLGATVEDQERAATRIPQLLSIPARIRFLSCEPLLGPVDLHAAHPARSPLPSNPQIHWVICGGESGPHARPMHPDWARDLRDQCAATNIPYLFKQWGEWLPTDQQHTVGQWPKRAVHSQVAAGQKYHHIGKKAAGRLLDGQLHHAFPATP